MKTIKFFSYTAVLLFLMTSGFVHAEPVAEGALQAPAARPVEMAFPVVVSPENPRLGEPLTIGLLGAAREAQARIVSASGELLSTAPFFDTGETIDGAPVLAAILAIPSTAQAGPATAQIRSQSSVIATVPFTIEPREFFHEDIPVPQSSADLITSTDPKKTEEAEVLWAILSHNGSDVYTDGTFIVPVNTRRITNPFGTGQVFIYPSGERRPPSIHAGIDYGVPTGTPVLACAAGKVALARPRIITGNTVIIEHYPGVYSLYYHLDKIAVPEGSMIEQGVPVGLSGATGFVTGPHLHWELRVGGINTDPDAFVVRPVLDRVALVQALRR
ncbi:MAG: peptidoglycan DD-metalloendopeptidase family protein [Treponema sp.]|jgi:murein DD-endopeptidase MepM/ murein hydrolase activator NlpD|nr:peptidoglycan DD-metalloendopeptidase family protein [Treponema sp.]